MRANYQHIIKMIDLSSQPGTSRVTARSSISGKENTRDIPTSCEKIERWMSGPENIQDVLPEVSAEDREFLMTGITPEEWKSLFGDEEDT